MAHTPYRFCPEHSGVKYRQVRVKWPIMDSQSENALHAYAHIEPTTAPDFLNLNVLDYYLRCFRSSSRPCPDRKNDTPAHFGSPGGAKFGK